MDCQTLFHLAVVVVVSTHYSLATVCPVSYQQHSGVCYKIVTSPRHNWMDARKYCQGEHGDLISIHSESLFQKLKHYTYCCGVHWLHNELVNSADPDEAARAEADSSESSLFTVSLWVGASDTVHEGTFRWVDDTPCCDKSWWPSGQPDTDMSLARTEDCVEIRGAFDGFLNDWECQPECGFICESNMRCPDIENCQYGFQTCTHSSNTCSKCEHNKEFFKPTTSYTKCERMCSWNSHYCWPGECSNELVRGCSCADGFHKVSNTTGTCQLNSDNQPSILTCNTVAVGPNGEKKRAMGKTNSPECDDLTDFFGNFQPSIISTSVMADFTVDVTSYKQPYFINVSHFGVTDVILRLKRKDLKGKTSASHEQSLKRDTTDGTKVNRTFTMDFNITIKPAQFTLSNGDSLCVQYEANGGGYLKSKSTTGDISSPVPYRKTKYTREICYKFDSVPPQHCSQMGQCLSMPVKIKQKVTNESHVNVEFHDWSDPPASGGSASSASGIESYQITIHETLSSSIPLKVDTKIVFTKIFDNSVTTTRLELPTDRPRLFCIVLEVKDIADNVRQARRFVLFDNSSFIDTVPGKDLFVESASQSTNYQWQTHHNEICLSWIDYFINQVYVDNQFLGEIEPEPHGFIKGVYEQNSGTLSVKGTENIQGIIGFEVSWQINDGNRSGYTVVDNFTNQQYCRDFGVRDGETYTISIQASDIVGNRKSDNRTVHIDRTVPHINNLWLVKNGYKRLFVHDSTDLSEMQLYFEAIDPHSGIKTIEWAFGTQDAGSELTTGSIKVNNNDMNCTAIDSCYCPAVGKCEEYGYILPLTRLVAINQHKGKHNRNYYFTLKVTNHAMLSNIEHLDILVDDSPPAVGVVLEGPTGGPEIDYTSSDDILVHWNGFIDHESGIKLYRVALAEKCLNKDDFKNISVSKYEMKEVPFTVNAYTFRAKFSGTRFTTIVALNNAMEISEAVCSDGITRDVTPPLIKNISLQNAHWSESLVCHQGSTWLFEEALSKTKLYGTESCKRRCSNESHAQPVALMLPTTKTSSKDKDISQFLCDHLEDYTNENVIYLPHGNIYLSWDTDETGSQIEDFYVGFGVHSTSPNLINFKSTHMHPFYKTYHSGIGSNRVFYIFIKAINKAGLEKITSIGPIIIDETPPLSRGKPDMRIVGDSVVIGWENDTFYDMEQTETINQIYFQFAFDKVTVSPMMEWRENISSTCDEYRGGCIKYPLKKLQRRDTDLGLLFYVSLYVYNRAGHFMVVNSDTFQIPSRYPPGHAVVLDIDPANVKTASVDIDAHFKTNTICVKWEGFSHHENITLEIFVGKSPGADDVLPVAPIIETDFHCEHSSALLPGVVYYVSLRATCSGGSSLSFSNGVTILPEKFLLSRLTLTVGKDCTKSEPEYLLLTNRNFTTLTYLPKTPLKLGVTYNIISDTANTSLTIMEDEGLVQIWNTGRYFTVLPFVPRPRFSVDCFEPCNKSYVITVFECPSAKSFSSHSKLSVSWRFGFPSPSSLHFKVFVVQYNNRGDIITKTMTMYTNGTGTLANSSDIEIPASYFVSGGTYKLELQPCILFECVSAAQSVMFKVDTAPKTGNITIAELTSDNGRQCSDLHLSWKGFKSDSRISLYQWGVYDSIKTEQMLTRWHSVTQNASDFEVHMCIKLPVYLHKDMSACVRAFSETGMAGQSCKLIDVLSNGEYEPTTVYDFDSTAVNWEELLKVLPSKGIGRTTKLLHNAEMDFGTVSSRVAGAVAYGRSRMINWYLMEIKQVPNQCHSSMNCAYHVDNTDGYVTIPTDRIHMNTLYYICAWANATEIHREHFTEIFDEIKKCSNGFILDDTPPSPGYVDVKHETGYLNDLSMISFQWDGFADNIDASVLGYSDAIQHYSYAIGSRPGGDDIMSFTSAGLSNSATELNVKAGDGSLIYITVKATDHSGLSSTAVSRELLVDTTPPVAGDVMIDCGGLNNTVCSSLDVPFNVGGFSDVESGVESFEVMVGSFCGTSNIATRTVRGYYGDIILNQQSIHDGHILCLTVKAHNRAGLVSSSSSQQFLIDTSPPTGGNVIDGSKDVKMDSDYQTDITHIAAHWRGFADAHSDIEYYRVGLGLQPFDDDIESMTNVGLQREITWNSTFIPGIKYFTTVEACNHAGLCQMKVSDGLILDNSPPIRGLVTIGDDNTHIKYLHKGSSVHIRWFGFEDPQSDIDHFDACIGSTAGYCDIVPFFPCLLQSNIIKSGLSLNDSRDYYATVRAINKVDIAVEQTSDAFLIDSTPPKLLITPAFTVAKTSLPGFLAQWEKSILTITWQFEDNESPITHHKVSLKTSHEGHTPVELQDVGPVNDVTIQLDRANWLKDGDTYTALVTSCNAAGICSTAESSKLLIDSTPPFVGGFKPPLGWHNFNSSTGSVLSKLLLTWYGFHDEESYIYKYYLTVSRSYSGSELSRGVIMVKGIDHHSLNEHQVNITLDEAINPDDKLILTVWAGNTAGLNSSVARVSVNALSTISDKTKSFLTGFLEIQKHSCDIHYCNNDCTCAVLGQPCIDVISNATCIALNSTAIDYGNLPKIDVFGGLAGEEMEITASSACLTAHWTLKNQSTNGTIERFEWSIGLLHQPIGEGIFDLKKDKPWYDVGRQQEIVYCLKNNLSLVHRQQYVVYVRVWYSEDTIHIFTSKPIHIDLTGPTLRRGKYISDSDLSCNQDYDYIDWTDSITACWRKVFGEEQGQLTQFTVSLGTSPKADDVYPTANVGLANVQTIDNATLHQGTKYYITVTAYNNVGLHTTLSSDGFVVDTDTPVSGVVFNTDKHIDTLFQHSTRSFRISWHGFQDHYSGLRSYSVALVDNSNHFLNESVFTDVGLNTKHIFSDVQLVHGKTYYGLVKATDAAGHVSNVSISLGKTMDITSPEGVECFEYSEIENIKVNVVDQENTANFVTNFTRDTLYNIQGKMSVSQRKILLSIGQNTYVVPVTTTENETYTFRYIFLSEIDGWSKINIQTDTLKDTTLEITVNKCIRAGSSNHSVLHVQQIGRSTLTVSLPIRDRESGIRKVRLGVGTVPGGFQTKQLSSVHPSMLNTVEVMVPHATTLYVTVVAENHAGLRSVFRSQPIIFDKTPPVINKTPSLKIDMNEASGNISDGSVNLVATWSVDDVETGVKMCYCALGHFPGSTDVRAFVKSNQLDSCTMSNVSVSHGDVLYATVRCFNNLYFTTETPSKPVIISTESPDKTLARLDIVQSNTKTNTRNVVRHVNITLQSNTSCVQLEWHGFSDSTGIEEYEYRLLYEGRVENGWTSAGKQTMAAVTRLTLQPGQVYRAEVRALNTGRHFSDSVSADVLIVDEPSLTGSPIEMRRSARRIQLDWINVFKTEAGVSCLYDVSVGTESGHNDVTEKAGHSMTTLEFTLDTSTAFGKVNELFVSVTCVVETGASKTLDTRFSLS